MRNEPESDEYVRELENQLGQNLIELQELKRAIRAQYLKAIVYLIPALVIAIAVASYLIWELTVGTGFQSRFASFLGTLGVFGLFVLSELVALSLGAIQLINRGNRVRYLQLTAIHEARIELARAGLEP